MRTAILLASMLVASAAAARPAKHVRIDYMLPSTSVTAGVQQRITKCPAPAEVQADQKTSTPFEAEFSWKAALVAKQTPSRLVSVDVDSGFLVDRETKIHFAHDWYLKDFNGKTTGQGGALAVSLVKAGAAVFAMAANPIVGVGVAAGATALKANYFGKREAIVLFGLPEPAPAPLLTATRWYVVCRASVERDLSTLSNTRDDVKALEARLIAGDASTPTQELLAMRRAQVMEVEDRLTITVKADKPLKPSSTAKGKYEGLDARVGGVDISPWFELVSVTRSVADRKNAVLQDKPDLKEFLQRRRLPGTFGYQVTISIDKPIEEIFGCEGAGGASQKQACWADRAASGSIDGRDLVYTRPIPATAKIFPFAAQCPTAATCDAAKDWPEGDKASGTLSIKLPQLSRLYTLRTGGSLFGGRTVGAEFGAMGEPTMLQYNVGSSGKDVAGLLDASVSAAQTVRDADNAAIKRRLDATKNRKDLETLLEEAAAGPSS